jgi:hypothetical protein
VSTFNPILKRLKERDIRGNLARRCAITLRWVESGRNRGVILHAQQQFDGPDD